MTTGAWFWSIELGCGNPKPLYSAEESVGFPNVFYLWLEVYNGANRMISSRSGDCCNE